MVKATKNKVMKIFYRYKHIIDFKTSFESKLSRLDPYPGPFNIHEETEIIHNTVSRLAIRFDDDYERIIKGFNEIINNL